MPYGVNGKRLRLSCLDDNGSPIRGYGTYTWTISSGKLGFKLVNEPCKNLGLRDRVPILTSHPWHR